jgi:hypothetical protein
MRTLLSLLVISSLVLAGCGRLRDSRVNPANWFGKSSSAPVERTASSEDVNPLIPERTSVFQRDPEDDDYDGTPVDQVVALRLEQTPSGAIVHATGQTLRQNAFDARLVSTGDDDDLAPVDGVLSFTLSAVQSQKARQGPERTRRIDVARFISAQTLADTRAIRVIGAGNARVARR